MPAGSQLAQRANPLRGAVRPGTEPGLEATRYFGPEMGATSNGVHAMVVEMDPETMHVQILRYIVVRDCGTVLNPLILAGQIHGGVAQGIGNAFFEQLCWSEEGQLLNASLADYLLPTALDVPRIDCVIVETPVPNVPYGVRGVGEVPLVPPAAAVWACVSPLYSVAGLSRVSRPSAAFHRTSPTGAVIRAAERP